MICVAQSANPRADCPHEGRVVFGAVEQVGHVEDEQGEVVGRVHAGVDVAQKPFVVVHEPLLDGRARGGAIALSLVGRAEEVGMSRVDIVALIQLALQPWQANEDSEVLPDIRWPQLDGIAHTVAGAELGTRYLSALDAQHAGAFEAVEVLGKGAAIGAEEVAFHEEHD